MNPELAIENRPGQMGLNLPPLEGGLRDVFEKPLAVLGAVATLAGGIGASANALINPSKADAAVSCPNPDAYKTPEFPLTVPSVSGGNDIKISAVVPGLGSGTSYACVGQRSLATFNIEQLSGSSGPMNVDIKSSSGVKLIKVLSSSNNFLELNCNADTVNTNLKHCLVSGPGLVITEMDPLASTDSQSVSISVDPSTINDMNPDNNASNVVFDVSDPGIKNTANSYFSIKYGKSNRWHKGERILKVPNGKCWQTAVTIKPIAPGTDNTKNISVFSVSMSAPSTKYKTSRKTFLTIPDNGVKRIISTCKGRNIGPIRNTIFISKNEVSADGSPTTKARTIQVSTAYFNMKKKTWKIK